MSPTPTLRRQVQVGFSEESVYGVRDSSNVIIRPVVRDFDVTPTQERMNFGRTGSIDPSRTFFSTQTYDYTATIECDPNMALWFLKWALGTAYNYGTNLHRFVPLPINTSLPSFTLYADTQQLDFIDTNERTIMLLGAVIETLSLRSAGAEADKSVTLEVSGPLQQPNVSDDYPYSMIGGGLMLPAEHPVVGSGGDDIIPYIHQNFGSNIQSPAGFNSEFLDVTFTINNTLKINTYPDEDNEPFISEIIYAGRQIQLEWTAEYKTMEEYHTFHEARLVEGLLWNATHLLQYDGTNQYKMFFYMPKVAISGAGTIIQAGETEETIEQTYTADLINRADTAENSVSTPVDVDLSFADDMNYHALQFTSSGAATTDPDVHLSFVQLSLGKVDTLASSDLTMEIWNEASSVPESLITGAVSEIVKTDWISDQVVNFVFNNPPKLDPMTSYYIVLKSSVAITSGDITITGESTGGTGHESDDSGSTWTSATDNWNYTIGYNGFPVVIEVESDGDYA